MKCLNNETLQKYMDGELSMREMKKISEHLDQCEHCMERFSKQCEWAEFEHHVFGCEQDTLDIDLDRSYEVLQRKLNKENRNGGYRMMKNKKKIVALVAALGILGVGGTAFGSEIIDYFKQSVFHDEVINEGIVRGDGSVVDMLEDGQFVSLDQKVTDNGVTVHITDAFVAENRISVNYRVEDETGALLPYEFDTEGLEIKDSGMENGKQVQEPTYYVDKDNGTFSVLTYLQTDNKDNLPFHLMKDGKTIENIGVRETRNEDSTEFVVSFVSVDSIPYPVTLNVNINKVGKTEGQWKAQIEITEDMLNE